MTDMERLMDKDIRQELLDKLVVDDNTAISLMTGLILAGGEIALAAQGKVKLVLSLRSSEAALIAADCLAQLYGYHPDIELYRPDDKRRSKLYVIEMPDKLGGRLMVDCGMGQPTPNGGWRYVLADRLPDGVDEAAMLCAMYIEGGKLYDGGSYRLELAVPSHMAWVERVLTKFDIPYSIHEAGDKPSLVLRGGAIADWLALVKCTKCMLAVCNDAVVSATRKDANRYSNCVTSNMDKAALAAAQQLNAIDKLKANGQWSTLAKEVRQVGNARVDNPHATMQELAELLGSNKSTVYHRMQKILDAADNN